jgi:hypothetical protein
MPCVTSIPGIRDPDWVPDVFSYPDELHRTSGFMQEPVIIQGTSFSPKIGQLMPTITIYMSVPGYTLHRE